MWKFIGMVLFLTLVTLTLEVEHTATSDEAGSKNLVRIRVS